MQEDLIKLRDATREITLGRAAYVNNETWYNGLKFTIEPPKTCADIYSGASYSRTDASLVRAADG